jgi:hypothetical protein
LTADIKAALNATTHSDKDAAFAERIRKWRPDAMAHLDDDALAAEVARQRGIATRYGVANSDLRARWVMIGIVTMPDFWTEPTIAALLSAGTGTPDIRFGDACALIATALRTAGREGEVWW